MLGTHTESPSTLTDGYSSADRTHELLESVGVQAQRRRRRCGRGLRKDSKFSRAFAKALSVRSRCLGRRLDQTEWKRLRDAVRKQTRRYVDPMQKLLSDLATRVLRLETTKPTSLKQVSDSIALLTLQAQMLSERIYHATEESVRLTETCSHITNRVKVLVPTGFQFQLRVPGVGICAGTVPTTAQAVCKACRSTREDAVYGWSGHELSWNDVQISNVNGSEGKQEDRVLERIRSIPPLAYQFIWTSILDVKFSREC